MFATCQVSAMSEKQKPVQVRFHAAPVVQLDMRDHVLFVQYSTACAPSIAQRTVPLVQ